jgi:hypothetical protein
VVFHLRGHYLVARPEFIEQTVRHEVEALGRVLREHHLLAAAARSDERREAVVSLLVGDRRLVTQRVDAPVDVGVVPLVELLIHLVHLPRRLGRRRVVEVHQRVAIDGPVQYREVVPNRRNA